MKTLSFFGSMVVLGTVFLFLLCCQVEGFSENSKEKSVRNERRFSMKKEDYTIVKKYHQKNKFESQPESSIQDSFIIVKGTEEYRSNPTDEEAIENVLREEALSDSLSFVQSLKENGIELD